MTPKKIIILVLILLFCVLYASFHYASFQPIKIYTAVDISSSVLFLIFCFLLFRTNLTRRETIILIIVGIIIRLSLVGMHAIGSDDIYRYIWDGKVQSNGINPYLYAPDDPHLTMLHSDFLPSKVNFPDMKSIYFPLSQWFFFAGYKIAGENVWGIKLLVLLSELLTIFSLFLLSKVKSIDPKFILIYVLCPLPILHFALDGHVDAFGLPLLILSIYFYLTEKKILSSILIGLSLSIKPVGLFIIPIFFLNEKKLSDKLKIVVVPSVVFFVQFLPYIFATDPFEAFLIYTKNWTFNGLIFNILNSFIKNNQIARTYCGIILLMSLMPIYFSKRELMIKIYYSLIFLIIFSPVVHPWYMAWIVVLLPVVQRWSGIVLASASSLTSFTILTYILSGVWKDYWLVLFLEYIPVYVLISTELFFYNETKKSGQINPL